MQKTLKACPEPAEGFPLQSELHVEEGLSAHFKLSLNEKPLGSKFTSLQNPNP
jgi:hypothetical protein